MLNSALNTICDEHRSLAAVVQGLRHLSGKYSDNRTPPDFGLLHAILGYLEEFPNRRHHPKEEAYLFARLQARTDMANRAIEACKAQHAEEAMHLRNLRAAVENFERKTGGAADFSAAVAAYSGHVLRHMAVEESELIPLALVYLTGEDWVAIGSAFGENGDPRFAEDAAQDHAILFRRLVGLASLGTGTGLDGES